MTEAHDSDLLPVEFGIVAHHERMPNGELRFRLFGADGNGYVRTIAGNKGGWQDSHYHCRVRETYIVESGWMTLAVWQDDRGEVVLTRFDPGQIVTTEPLRRHNVYLPAKAVIHTVKHGSVSDEPDWHAAPELDVLTKVLSAKEVMSRSQRSSIPK